jgi:FlaA1/EpsC-like NDP-sugar epimerase
MTLKKMTSLPKIYKQLLMFILDSILVILVLLSSFFLRFSELYLPNNSVLLLIIFSPLIAIPIFHQFGLYRSILRYIGFNALWTILQAVTLYSVVLGLFIFMTGIDGVPRSVIIINWFASLIVIIGLRMAGRWMLNNNHFNDATKVVIYGAGSAGIELSIALKESKDYDPVAFIDDNIALQGRSIYSINIISIDELKILYKKRNIKEVLLAMPSVSQSRRKEIIDLLQPLPIKVRSLPGMTDLVKGKVKLEDLHEISIKDLLGRDSVVADQTLIRKNIFNKVVMVTGAGGSIGSELCRQISQHNPKILIMYDHSEFSLYNINKEFTDKNLDTNVIPILGSVNNSHRLKKILGKFKVQTIYHTAAYKHVPMVEFNTSEGIINNVFGTFSAAKAALDSSVETFVLISTDKAVRPTSTMGATKRLAEIVIQALAEKYESTNFTIVRFGNVLGSSGSVIPIFSKQIKQGGPVTVTDSKMMRYFMTIPEAVELVIQSGAMGSNGEVFILDMGELVSIDFLAKKMIELSGLSVKDKTNLSGDIEIIYSGIRPGEKLYEELLIGKNTKKTNHPMIMSANEEFIKIDKLILIMDNLQLAIDNFDYIDIRDILIQSVPGYIPEDKIMDYLDTKNYNKLVFK